jgi:hypothetical protein
VLAEVKAGQPAVGEVADGSQLVKVGEITTAIVYSTEPWRPINAMSVYYTFQFFVNISNGSRTRCCRCLRKC